MNFTLDAWSSDKIRYLQMVADCALEIDDSGKLDHVSKKIDELMQDKQYGYYKDKLSTLKDKIATIIAERRVLAQAGGAAQAAAVQLPERDRKALIQRADQAFKEVIGELDSEGRSPGVSLNRLIGLAFQNHDIPTIKYLLQKFPFDVRSVYITAEKEGVYDASPTLVTIACLRGDMELLKCINQFNKVPFKYMKDAYVQDDQVPW